VPEIAPMGAGRVSFSQARDVTSHLVAWAAAASQQRDAMKRIPPQRSAWWRHEVNLVDFDSRIMTAE